MDIITGLQSSFDQTIPYFDLPDSELNKPYGPGKWTVRQVLHHLADADSVLLERIKRAIAEPGSVVWNFEQDAWCQALDYANQPMELSKMLYTVVRRQAIDLATRYYETHGHNPFVHSQTGLRTLRDEFDKLVWHNEKHLEQMRNVVVV
jgi:uncharacterized damage-inducible protein DinB